MDSGHDFQSSFDVPADGGLGDEAMEFAGVGLELSEPAGFEIGGGG